jgi:prepilin-type N-terminal cleavage/methylation domain-containing protein
MIAKLQDIGRGAGRSRIGRARSIATLHSAPDGRHFRRRGFTLLEMMIVLLIVGLLFAIAIRPLNTQRRKLNARSARVAASQGLALARSASIARGCVARFHLNVTATPNSKMWVTVCKATTIGRVGAAIDTLGRIDTLSGRFGVTVSGTSDSVSYDARGFSVGYTSAAYAFRAGTGARDSLTVSPMGRVAQ